MTPRPAGAETTTLVAEAPKAPWRLAFLLAFMAALCGILLTGVSVWFLGAVALAGLGPAAFAFNFHFPAALVRLFAIGRTAAKYGERVMGHRAALTDQVHRRARLLAAMAAAPSVRTAGWQLGNEDRLSDYMDDVEDLDYGRLRVGMPSATLAASAAGLGLATKLLAPLAMLPVAALGLAGLIGMRVALPRAHREWARTRLSHRGAGRRLGALAAAVVPLQAEHAWDGALATAFGRFEDAGIARFRLRQGLASLELLFGFFGPLAALSVLLAAWYAGARGTALLMPAFLGFSWLAFGESVSGVSRAVLGHLRKQAAGEALSHWTGTGAADELAGAYPLALRTLTLADVPLETPAGRPLGGSVSVTLGRGRPTALVGASGTGKTTLLKRIAGWFETGGRGGFAADGAAIDCAARRALAHIGLHDAAVLSDTVRENLFASAASAEACWEALAAVELAERVRAAGGLDAWISQDMLSLGEAQRLNLARALLSNAPLVLLDEPTEHLDAGQGERILKRVLDRLSDRIVVYATHDPRAAALAVQEVDCGFGGAAEPRQAA